MLVLVVGAFVLYAVASGVLGNPLDRPPKVIPRQVVQVECSAKTYIVGVQRSTFFYFWSDGTITLEENKFFCPDSMETGKYSP